VNTTTLLVVNVSTEGLSQQELIDLLTTAGNATIFGNFTTVVCSYNDTKVVVVTPAPSAAPTRALSSGNYYRCFLCSFGLYVLSVEIALAAALSVCGKYSFSISLHFTVSSKPWTHYSAVFTNTLPYESFLSLQLPRELCAR
jgi:hypothetical protein